MEHDTRSVVVFADHFAIPYKHLVKKLTDDKARRAASGQLFGEPQNERDWGAESGRLPHFGGEG